MLEGYTSLGFLAGQTSRLELGLLVTGVTYRHPGLLAKIVTTLDVLSRGRAMLGHRRRLVRARAPRPRRPLPVDHGAVRAPRGDPADRAGRRGTAAAPYDGKHYRLDEITLVPQPLRPRRSADPDRRHRRAQDAPPGRAVRATPATSSRTTPDEVAAQARRPPRPLRRRRPRLRRDREDDRRQPHPSPRRRRRLARLDGGSAPTSASARSGSAPDADRPGRLDRADGRAGRAATLRDRRLSRAPAMPRYASLRRACRPVGSSSSTVRRARARRRSRRRSSRRLAHTVAGAARWTCSTRSGPGPTPTSPIASGRTSSIAPARPTTARWSAPPRRGCDVLADHVLSEPWRLDDLLRLSSGLDVLLVHVTCDAQGAATPREDTWRPRPRHGAPPAAAGLRSTATATSPSTPPTVPTSRRPPCSS